MQNTAQSSITSDLHNLIAHLPFFFLPVKKEDNKLEEDETQRGIEGIGEAHPKGQYLPHEDVALHAVEGLVLGLVEAHMRTLASDMSQKRSRLAYVAL